MHFLRPSLSIGIVALTCAFVPLASATTGCNAVEWEGFRDVQGCTLYYPAIEWLRQEKIAEGVGQPGTRTAFEPTRTINRAEFTKLVLLASGTTYPPACSANPFPDVPKDAWYAPFICAAKTKGIISGFPDGTFKPGIEINFANGAKILAKSFALPTQDADARFQDESGIWYRPYTQSLLRKKAVAPTISAFTQSLTRGEMAEMLFRLKTGKSSFETPDSAEEAGLGMGFEPHQMEEAFGLWLSDAPPAPYVFAYSDTAKREGSVRLNVKGYRFFHTLQTERCTGQSGRFESCQPLFTDWSVAFYPTSSPVDRVQKYLESFGNVRERTFGDRKGSCSTVGIEGEYTEYCFIPWKKDKTLIVVREYIDTGVAYANVPGITSLSDSDAIFATVRQGMVLQ